MFYLRGRLGLIKLVEDRYVLEPPEQNGSRNSLRVLALAAEFESVVW